MPNKVVIQVALRGDYCTDQISVVTELDLSNACTQPPVSSQAGLNSYRQSVRNLMNLQDLLNDLALGVISFQSYDPATLTYIVEIIGIDQPFRLLSGEYLMQDRTKPDSVVHYTPQQVEKMTLETMLRNTCKVNKIEMPDCLNPKQASKFDMSLLWGEGKSLLPSFNQISGPDAALIFFAGLSLGMRLRTKLRA